jgi:hypothetical protein
MRSGRGDRFPRGNRRAVPTLPANLDSSDEE